MLRLLIAVCLLLIAIPGVVPAGDVACGGCDGLLNSRLKALAMTDDWYSESLDALKTSDQSLWTDEEIDSYLEVALLRIYTATNIYLQQQPTGELDPTGLAEGGCLDEWPGNPFNEWQPIRILPVSSGYSAGDIAYELCPFSHSTKGRQLSYQYYIYGADEEGPVPDVYGRNAEWAEVPPGVAFTLGVIYQTDDEIAETKEFLKRIAEQQARASEGEPTGQDEKEGDE